MTTSASSRVLHVGVVEAAAHVAHGFGQPVGLFRDDLGPLVRHQPGDRHLDQRQFLTSARSAPRRRRLSPSRLAAIAMSALLVPTTIMWWLSCAHGRRHGAVLHIAEAGDEGVGDGAGAAMALDQRDLADVVVTGPSPPARSRRRDRPRARVVGAWFSMTPMTRHADLVGALGRGDVEIGGLQSLAEFDRVLGLPDSRRRGCRR